MFFLDYAFLERSLVALAVLSSIPAVYARISYQQNSGLGSRRARCTTARAWTGGGFDRLDCIRAIDEMWNQDVVPREGEVYEFLSGGGIPTTRLQKIVTPIIYESRKFLLLVESFENFTLMLYRYLCSGHRHDK